MKDPFIRLAIGLIIFMATLAIGSLVALGFVGHILLQAIGIL